MNIRIGHLIRSGKIENEKVTYSSTVKGTGSSVMEVDIDKLFTANLTIRKEKNVVIWGINLDSLKEGESVLSIITNLIDSNYESATIVDCKRSKN